MNETKIMSDELFDKLMALRDTVTQSSWEIGDLTQDIIQYNILNETRASKTEIYKAVGSAVGKASRTVREIADVAGQYDQLTRGAFDVLSFDHFRVAARSDDPKTCLQWAMERVGETGKPATVDEMIYRFGGEPKDVDPENIDDLIVMPQKIRARLAKFATSDLLVQEATGLTHKLENCLREISQRIDKQRRDEQIVEDMAQLTE
jgi:hypothetical protein